MEVRIAVGDITGFKAGAVLVSVFEPPGSLERETRAVDQALGGAMAELVRQGEIKGKLGEITLLHSLGKLAASRIVVVGLGKKEELAPDRVRRAVGEACRSLQQKDAGSIATALPGVGVSGITPELSAQLLTEGALLGTYLFRKHITKEAGFKELGELTLVTASSAERPLLEAGVRKGRILVEAVNLARDMVNEPANVMTPTHMAEEAARLSQSCGLELTVLEREQARELGMGAFLGVARGSAEPPKFIVLRYRGADSDVIDLALVGKGITFDSGGISLKPSEGMGEMKGDMAGGAAVMAALGAVAQLKPRLNVVAMVAATENLPSGTALKPGDILTALGGKTIEIISTDAEGRLTLADALGYARKLGAKRLIDVATLTGACKVALGDICSGAFTNNQELLERVLTASRETGERVWQMPMFEEYQEQNKSDVADIKNVGGKWGGASTAAKFLEEFVGDTPWVHLDIAGTDMSEKEKGYTVKGATGVLVRTLVNVVLSLAEETK
ncbi:MAG: leucyl aminopeptidase [Chloroflexota bacterium]